MPKISIIIPCYNVAPYIDRCMTSIVAQTIGMNSLEIICIDDASTDDTWEHLQKWEKLLPDQVLLIRQEVNRRQGTARNIGLQYASSEWIAFVDGDDWLEPDYFELLYKPVQKYSCDVVCCDAERDFSDSLVYFDEDQKGDGEDLYLAADTEETRKQLIAVSAVGEAAWGKIIRRRLLTDFQIYFPEDLTYEDHYWVPMLHIYTTEVYVIQKKLYHYFVNYQSTILVENADYHMDWVTVWLMKWAEYERRGLLKEYREELEYDCLQDAVGLMKVIILRYEKPSFSFFQLVREMIREQVPDYRENRYAKNLTGIYGVFLEALYAPADRAEFLRVVEQAKQYWQNLG